MADPAYKQLVVSLNMNKDDDKELFDWCIRYARECGMTRSALVKTLLLRERLKEQRFREGEL